jgi:ArsR family transcriptional regulator, virulence genes transcriptional regulator
VMTRGASSHRLSAASKSKLSVGFDIEVLSAKAHQASEFLKALSHEVRLLILCFLIEGEKSVSEIEKMLKLRQPAVSQQLARLRADGLVEARRNGKNIYYSLARTEVRDVIGVLHNAFCRPRKSR